MRVESLITALKETPLVEVHRASGARMVDFAGWFMPVQYSSIITEHMAVRKSVGLFDVSHMGEFVVKGDRAKEFVQFVIANDVERLQKPNSALYTQFVNYEGGTVDDLLVYRREHDYLLVVNASNIEKDWQWLNQHVKEFSGVDLVDESPQTALLAVQGPKAVDVMKSLVGPAIEQLPTFHYCDATVGDIKVGVGRTGYTGEDGFEIFANAKDAVRLWKLIVQKGEPFGIQLCGLGARDTLRLEACLPLYGHELDEQTGPLEAGIGWSVKLNKGNFIGRDKLLEQKEKGMPKQLVGLVTEGKALPRQGYPIKKGDSVVGEVTSGSQGIFVGYPIALGYVKPELANKDQQLAVEIRGANVAARVVPLPFYKRKR
jgi:aminomethyltransferase